MGMPASAAESMLQHPAGFADIVAKVKPAVISVRVKVPASAEPSLFEQNRNDEEDDQIPAPSGSPFDNFMRQFRDQFGEQFGGQFGPNGPRRHEAPAKARAFSFRRTATQ